MTTTEPRWVFRRTGEGLWALHRVPPLAIDTSRQPSLSTINDKPAPSIVSQHPAEQSSVSEHAVQSHQSDAGSRRDVSPEKPDEPATRQVGQLDSGAALLARLRALTPEVNASHELSIVEGTLEVPILGNESRGVIPPERPDSEVQNGEDSNADASISRFQPSESIIAEEAPATAEAPTEGDSNAENKLVAGTRSGTQEDLAAKQPSVAADTTNAEENASPTPSSVHETPSSIILDPVALTSEPRPPVTLDGVIPTTPSAQPESEQFLSIPRASVERLIRSSDQSCNEFDTFRAYFQTNLARIHGSTPDWCCRTHELEERIRETLAFLDVVTERTRYESEELAVHLVPRGEDDFVSMMNSLLGLGNDW